MLQPPSMPGHEHSGSKQCWTCPATTPYSQGFCDSCWSSLPRRAQTIYYISTLMPPPWTGLIAEAVCSAAKIVAKPPPKPRPNRWASSIISLKDLGLDL